MNKTMGDYQARVQKVLNQALSDNNIPDKLREAMRYSTLTGGKRIRAMLVYASGLTVNAPISRLDAVAAAVECIHCYSLIHDDLPAMDDDDLRRGQATSHIKFDQATAILAGDALQTLAFELINCAKSDLNDTQCRAITLKLAASSGAIGMVGGQMLDVIATKDKLDREQLENIHRRKTGALINAAVLSGALCGDHIQAKQLESLDNYAICLGLAFQVIDDVLDVESSTEKLGKTSGADQAMGKVTYPSLIGLAQSKELAENLYHQAIASISSIGDNTQLLEDLAQLVIKRTH